MREHGLVTTPAGLGLSGHACWTYDDDADLRRAALAFLRDGARLGQRLMTIGIPGLGAAGDVIEIAPDALPWRGPADRLTFYSDALDDALEDGY
jgi:hypothetical protein